jgi:hypothetical protein
MYSSSILFVIFIHSSLACGNTTDWPGFYSSHGLTAVAAVVGLDTVCDTARKK